MVTEKSKHAAMCTERILRHRYGRIPSILACATLLFLSSFASAQSDFEIFFGPYRNELPAVGDLKGFYSSEEDVEDEETELQIGRVNSRIRLQLDRVGDEDNEWFLSFDSDSWTLDGDAHFDESGVELPDSLHDISMGVTWKRFMDNGWLFGQNLYFGSASDNPFASFEECYGGGTSYLRIPSGEYDAWMVFLSVDSNRQFPVLPGVAYQFVLAEELWTIIGVPVMAVGWQPTERIQVNASYLPLKRITAEISYELSDPLLARLRFLSDQAFFRREDRHEWNDSIEIEQNRISLELEYSMNEQISIGAEGGYVFSRRIGEGKNYDERSENDIDIEDGWFGGVALRWRI